MKLSSVRSCVGPVFSLLGVLLIGVGFFLPVYFTSPPENANFANPYPPVLNGWRALVSLPAIGPILAFVLLAAIMLLGSSLLLLFQKRSLRVTRTRLLLSFACMALLVFDSLYSWLLNFAGSPDGAAASPTFAFGRGFGVLLAGLAVCGFGVGIASIGAFIGACLGIVIGYFITLGIGLLLNVLPAISIPGINLLLRSVENFLPIVIWLGVSILGSILGGWIVHKGQAQFRQIDEDLSNSPRE